MKPMLAGSIKDLKDIKYPVLCTPKIDGIRCLTFHDGAKSRKLKPIPNSYIQSKLTNLNIPGLDGELIVPGAENFGVTSSAVMRESGKPNFVYRVFDVHNVDRTYGYVKRLEILAARIDNLSEDELNWVSPLLPIAIFDMVALLKYEKKCLEAGYEGIMIRSEHGPYKEGRSTVREGYLLKLKRFEDSEAKVIGFKEWLENTNKLEYDALGHAKRSSAKVGKIPKGSLGALLVSWKGFEVEIGTGYTDSQRDQLWAQRDSLVGRIVKFKYQPVGAKDKPRFPVFLGFRDKRDM